MMKVVEILMYWMSELSLMSSCGWLVIYGLGLLLFVVTLARRLNLSLGSHCESLGNPLSGF